MTMIDPTAPSTPGLPRPVQIGTAHYLDPVGVPRTAPIYEAGPATNGQRIQAEDVGAGWTLVREEPLPPAPAHTPEQKLAAARAALAPLATIDAPVLTADVLDVLTDLAAALED